MAKRTLGEPGIVDADTIAHQKTELFIQMHLLRDKGISCTVETLAKVLEWDVRTVVKVFAKVTQSEIARQFAHKHFDAMAHLADLAASGDLPSIALLNKIMTDAENAAVKRQAIAAGAQGAQTGGGGNTILNVHARPVPGIRS